MLRAVIANDELTCHSSVRGIAVYLDMFAIKLLAKGDSSLRQRFVAAVHGGADLLFSLANAVELTGPQGTSSEVIQSFLE